MLIKRMTRDNKLKFHRTFIDNGDGTFSLRTSTGSSSGVQPKSSKHRDVMASFARTIDSADAIRIFS